MPAHLVFLAITATITAGCAGSAPQPAPEPTTAPTTTQTATQTPDIRASQLAAAEASLQTAIVDVCQRLVKAKLNAPLTAKFAPTTAKPEP